MGSSTSKNKERPKLVPLVPHVRWHIDRMWQDLTWSNSTISFANELPSMPDQMNKCVYAVGLACSDFHVANRLMRSFTSCVIEALANIKADGLHRLVDFRLPEFSKAPHVSPSVCKILGFTLQCMRSEGKTFKVLDKSDLDAWTETQDSALAESLLRRCTPDEKDQLSTRLLRQLRMWCTSSEFLPLFLPELERSMQTRIEIYKKDDSERKTIEIQESTMDLLSIVKATRFNPNVVFQLEESKNFAFSLKPKITLEGASDEEFFVNKLSGEMELIMRDCSQLLMAHTFRRFCREASKCIIADWGCTMTHVVEKITIPGIPLALTTRISPLRATSSTYLQSRLPPLPMTREKFLSMASGIAREVSESLRKMDDLDQFVRRETNEHVLRRIANFHSLLRLLCLASLDDQALQIRETKQLLRLRFTAGYPGRWVSGNLQDKVVDVQFQEKQITGTPFSMTIGFGQTTQELDPADIDAAFQLARKKLKRNAAQVQENMERFSVFFPAEQSPMEI